MFVLKFVQPLSAMLAMMESVIVCVILPMDSNSKLIKVPIKISVFSIALKSKTQQALILTEFHVTQKMTLISSTSKRTLLTEYAQRLNIMIQILFSQIIQNANVCNLFLSNLCYKNWDQLHMENVY